jgi:hypothetical protein
VDYRYIRVKRRKQTFCLLCPANDTVQTVKQKLASALQQHGPDSSDSPDESSMRLQLPGSDATVLEDDSILGNELKDDAVVYLVLAVSDTEWEPVDIEVTEIQDAS